MGEIAVAPLVGAWIETLASLQASRSFSVAPLVGAWIETTVYGVPFLCCSSLPSWERGLKLLPLTYINNNRCVAPLVGAWIETSVTGMLTAPSPVAPLVGAWIETLVRLAAVTGQPSLPSWERGLKHVKHHARISRKRVAPLVGAWIETM